MCNDTIDVGLAVTPFGAPLACLLTTDSFTHLSMQIQPIIVYHAQSWGGETYMTQQPWGWGDRHDSLYTFIPSYMYMTPQ